MPVMVFNDAPSDPVAPGVTRSRLESGGKDGPGGVVRDSDQPGGGTWSQMWFLGRAEDEWRMLVPDIRMAANQIWPLHWHDCWTAVVVLDGTLMMGDWWMARGDVLIAEPGVEYGLLLSGPKGCELLEIFARDILSPGGYGEEYRDHPTLRYLKGLETTAFVSRPPARVENGRRQIVPVDETPGLHKGRLDGGAYWDLGDPDDPERGIVFDRKLAAGAALPAVSVGDWRGTLVLDGSMTVGETEFAEGDVLLVEPDAKMPATTAGADGVHLLEMTRTAAALTR
ncbi:MAG: cupin domain-containing protein [Frankia sp.]